MKRLITLIFALLLTSTQVLAECSVVEFDNDSNIVRMIITDSSTGNGKTALSSATSNLIINTIADVETVAGGTSYTSAGSTIETIATIGTYAAPTATKVRFQKLDDTKYPGTYELQLDNSRFSVANAKNLLVSIPAIAGSGTFDSLCNIPLVHPIADVWSYAPAAELSAVPSSAPSMVQAMQWIYELMKHKLTQTGTTGTIFKNDSSTSLGTSTTSDDGTTFTRGKYN